MALGIMFPCKLLTFASKISEQYVNVWCELVKKEDWRMVEEKRLQDHQSFQKIKDSDSPDIFISEKGRIRIDIKGNSAVYPEHALFLKFYPIAEDIHIFPVLQKRIASVSAPSLTTIIYSRDSDMSRSELHSLSFNPWILKYQRTSLRSVPTPSLPEPTSIQAQTAVQYMTRGMSP